ncbi:TPA: hypothetical protein QH133_004201, partial [Escherichia coli]|nr:hypothetical protein [Escherichia coli]
MNFEFVKEVLESNGIQCKVQEDKLYLQIDGKDLEVRFNEGYDEAISNFAKSRQYRYDLEKRTLIGYRTVEVFVQRLNQNIFETPSFEFKSNSS